MDGRESLIAVMIAFLVVDTIIIVLRMFVRAHLVKSLGLDDWVMVAGYLSYVGLLVVVFISIHYGLGRHMATLEPYQLMQATKYFIIGQFVYALGSALIKVSVALLLMRLTPNKWYRYILLGSIFIVSVWSLATFLIIILQCRPLAAAWGAAKGTCMDPMVLIKTGYAFSALDIATGWLYALLPVAMLWNVQLSRRLKFSVTSVLAMGVVASSATIVRLRYLLDLSDQEDLLYSVVTAQMWSIVELSISILAASAATLRPLIRYVGISSTLGSSGDATPHKNTSGSRPGLYYGSGHELGYMKSTSGKDHNIDIETISKDNDSQELILDRKRIQKRTEVTVQYNQQV